MNTIAIRISRLPINKAIAVIFIFCALLSSLCYGETLNTYWTQLKSNNDTTVQDSRQMAIVGTILRASQPKQRGHDDRKSQTRNR
jgi:hypothetical protein